MSELRDRTIIVTGAAGAIGTVTCHQLAAAGARLVLVDLSKERLQALAGELPGTGHRIQASALESPAACRSVVQGIEGPIYGLVHLAGIFVAHDLTPAAREVYDRTMAANATNAFDMVCALSDRLVTDEPARMVFASSMAYRRGSLGHVAYAMAKGAIAGLVRALSRNYGPDVLVNAVAPGVIDSPMPQHILAVQKDAIIDRTPLRRLGTVEEVANVITFLMGPKASFITGQVINVDGGAVNG